MEAQPNSSQNNNMLQSKFLICNSPSISSNPSSNVDTFIVLATFDNSPIETDGEFPNNPEFEKNSNDVPYRPFGTSFAYLNFPN